MRHIPPEDIPVFLRAGKGVEQLLPPGRRFDETTIRTVGICVDIGGGFLVNLHEVVDAFAGEEFFDIHAFRSVDDDAPDGVWHECASPEEAIEFACAQYGAKVDRFVVEGGLISEEYLDQRGLRNARKI